MEELKMLSINIDNPKIEDFVQKEFGGNSENFIKNIYEYMEFHKIKKETDEAREEIKNGLYYDENELFDELAKKYAN